MRYEITILGVVQGVGYRPFVAALAEQLHIRGSVRNSGGVVRIDAFGDAEAMDNFICRLRSYAPPAARVDRVQAVPVNEDGTPPGDFGIVESEAENGADLPLLPADLPLCEACLEEMRNPEDRRYRYPFISCVNCGPRYSITEEVPYDRAHITMREFGMCPSCREEYTGMCLKIQSRHQPAPLCGVFSSKCDAQLSESDFQTHSGPEMRRRHAQTISCHSCGPQLRWMAPDGEGGFACREKEAALEAAQETLRAGGVIALKGIGGYQFACRPDRGACVERLRRLKHRDNKPFAVMFPSLESIREVCLVSKQEEELLCSSARPIVLLCVKKREYGFSCEVSGESRFLGAFLPYTGLHQLLTQAVGPLVMTSGNVTDEPILTADEEMEKLLRQNPSLLAGIAWNDRRIVTPLDDSLMRMTGGRPQLLRRSRGFVPDPVGLPSACPTPVLAMGGDLKAAFCLAWRTRGYMSQYFGDLESYQVLRTYLHAVDHMEKLFGIVPRAIACDLHPGYASSREASRLAGEEGLPLFAFQHHHAHGASVMAEHGLRRCIAVVFDGTGYGTDGTVWGGEFLLCEGSAFLRAGHLEETELIGGDVSAKDAGLTALCHLEHAGCGLSGEKKEKEEPELRRKIISAALSGHINTERSTSMGRLFDAVCALLGIRETNSYEGECAIALENAAARAMECGAVPAELSFPLREEENVLLADRTALIRKIFRETKETQTWYKEKDRTKITEALALGFHEAVAHMVLEICRRLRERFQENTVALSGGVFANVILQERCRNLLEEEGFLVYVNEKVPGNDGGIALGQAWLAALKLLEDNNSQEEKVCAWHCPEGF